MVEEYDDAEWAVVMVNRRESVRKVLVVLLRSLATFKNYSYCFPINIHDPRTFLLISDFVFAVL